MSIRDYLGAIVHGWWMVVAATVLGAGVAVLLIATTQPVYAGTVTFFVNTTPETGVNPLQGDQYAQQRVATYVRLVSSDRLAEMIKDDTGTDQPVSAIAASLSGESPLNTVLLTATATGASRDEVLAITRSVSTQFVKMIRAIDPTVSLEVTSKPALQQAPIAPRTKLDLGLGIVAGLIVGAGGAIMRRALDTTVRSTTGLHARTGADILGIISLDRRGRKAPLLVGAAKASARAEAFRKLRTNLRGRQLPGGIGTIVVTSSVYGEGKSTTAANLAVTCADGGDQVLLIDADLRRPRIATYWQLSSSSGLAEVLAGTANVQDCLHPTENERLTLLPSGHLPADPVQAIGSPRMTELLMRLRDRFDVILIDTPPLLPVTDAAIIAGQTDGAIIVARFGRTRLAQVAGAVDALDSAGARLLGCVVNMAPSSGSRRYSVRSAAKGAADPPPPPTSGDPAPDEPQAIQTTADPERDAVG